jgi:hypothetical protein
VSAEDSGQTPSPEPKPTRPYPGVAAFHHRPPAPGRPSEPMPGEVWGHEYYARRRHAKYPGAPPRRPPVGLLVPGIIVVVGIVLIIVWSFWIGLIVAVVGLLALGGLALYSY